MTKSLVAAQNQRYCPGKNSGPVLTGSGREKITTSSLPLIVRVSALATNGVMAITAQNRVARNGRMVSSFNKANADAGYGESVCRNGRYVKRYRDSLILRRL